MLGEGNNIKASSEIPTLTKKHNYTEEEVEILVNMQQILEREITDSLIQFSLHGMWLEKLARKHLRLALGPA